MNRVASQTRSAAVERAQRLIRKNGTSWIWKIVRTLFIIGISYIFLFPVLYMISMAVRSPETVNDPSAVWIPRDISLESIRIAMSPEILDYWRSISLTLLIAVGSTVGSLASCSLVGYGFARFRFKGKNFMFALLLLTIIVPPQTMVLSSVLNFRNLHLLDTPFTFIMPAFLASGLRAGLFVYIFRQFFLGIPGELEEAARIDGCHAFSTFVRIILPLAKPAIVTVLLFSFIWHWNDYSLSAIYFTNGKPISVMLNEMQSQLQNAKLFNFVTNTPDQIRTYLQAGALLTILPPLVLYIFTQRLFTESVERTGIVG